MPLPETSIRIVLDPEKSNLAKTHKKQDKAFFPILENEAQRYKNIKKALCNLHDHHRLKLHINNKNSRKYTNLTNTNE